MAVFFAACVASLWLITLNLLTNLNTYVFLNDVASECYSPRDIAPALNYCYEGSGGN